MQGDMIIHADIITKKNVTIHTNGYQVRIEDNIAGDSNININNLNNDAAWEFVDEEKNTDNRGQRKKQAVGIYGYRG